MNEADFAERLASPTPTPGGGAAAARVGLLASSLLRMVIGLTRKKVGVEDAAAELEAAAGQASSLSERFRALETADVEVFEGFMEALRLPRGSQEEKERREFARRDSAARATRVPLDLLGTVVATLKLARRLQDVAGRTPLAAASDLTCAVEFARAAFQAGELNVDANLPYLEASVAARATEEREQLREELEALYGELS